jgi:hypothetical protein
MPLEDYTDEEDNPLFRAIKKCEWSKAEALLATQEGKDMANQQDAFLNTPLHAALGYKAPDDFIIDLIQSNKGATKIHGTGNEWLPLHVAAMYGSSTKVMETIIRAYPQALDDPGEGGIKGRTPRHFSQRFVHNRELLERSTNEWVAIIQSDSGGTQ